jgi:multiple sugar transport system substrate-binding protein
MKKKGNTRCMTMMMVICMLLVLTTNVMATGVSEKADAAKEIELSFGWWGAEGRHAYTQQLSKQFAELNPGTSFTFQPNSWGGYWEKIAVQAAGGNLPTVMQFYISYIPTYADNNLLLDLTPYVEDGTLDVSTIEANLLKTGYHNGKLVTIPLSMSARAVVCNPIALQNAGMQMPSSDWTWSDYERMAIEYTKKTGKYAIDGYNNHWMQMQLMLLQQGYQIFNEDGTGLGFDDHTPLLEFYSHWKKMVDNGCVYTPDVNATRKQVPSEQSFLAQNQAAFLYDSNSLPGWTGNQSLKLHPAPYRDGQVGEDVNWAIPGLSFSVSAKADEATARKAAQFINWWLNSEEVAEVQGTDRGFPASQAVQNYLKQKELTALQQDTFDYFAYLQDHSGPMPPIDPNGAFEVSDHATIILEELLSGKITVLEAAKKAYKDFTEILVRNHG